MELKDRFLKYVSFDTQSDENSTTFPSTDKQLVLLNYLADEGNVVLFSSDCVSNETYFKNLSLSSIFSLC